LEGANLAIRSWLITIEIVSTSESLPNKK
jgi:hypothetical protein